MSISMQVYGQKSIRLIVRGDDMGFSHSANEAILECYKEGIMTTVEVMPVTPWFPEVIKMCNEHPGLDVGIHLALTSEWTNLKWRPLTSVPSLVDGNGYFLPMIWTNENYGDGEALSKQDWDLNEIEKEVAAQISMVKKAIPHVSHVSAHMGFTRMDEEVQAVVKKLAKENDIDIDLTDHSVEIVRLSGPRTTPEEKINTFIQLLETLKPGKTYLFLEHPAQNVAETRAVYHIGYENVSTDREGILQMWTDLRVKEVITNLNIQLISYKDLKGNQ